MAAWIKMSLGMELGFGAGDFVLDGDPVAPPQKGRRTPRFSAHVYCDQMAGWMKLVLGMVVGLSPGEFVLDEDPAPSPKRPTFSHCMAYILESVIDSVRRNVQWSRINNNV